MYEVPIDLKTYGWSETLINYLNDSDIQGLLALDSTSLEVFSRCLEAREEYLEDEYKKVRESLEIRNFENVYTKPTFNWSGLKLKLGESFIRILLISGLVFAGYKLLKD